MIINIVKEHAIQFTSYTYVNAINFLRLDIHFSFSVKQIFLPFFCNLDKVYVLYIRDHELDISISKPVPEQINSTVEHQLNDKIYDMRTNVQVKS